jgi:hypothetical protein
MKDSLILIAFCLFAGLLLFGKNNYPAPQIPQAEDTIVAKKNVAGKKALFIGDSHTSNHSFGWQKQLCEKTGMIMKNVSVGGKTTDWMLNEGVYGMDNTIDFLFIYGGANDMYGAYMKPEDCLDNIQRLVNLGNGRGAGVIVMTGFSANKVVTVSNPGYKLRYAKLQSLMLSDLKGCDVVDCRGIIEKSDCSDGLCHMRKSGHTKMAMSVIEQLNLDTIHKPVDGRN